MGKAKTQFIAADAPLRHGSYRALASTANTFAAENFMDELAVAADRDPLEFRLAHLENPRLSRVLEEAAKQFDWTNRRNNKREYRRRHRLWHGQRIGGRRLRGNRN